MTATASSPTESTHPLCRYDDIPNRSAKSIALRGVNSQGAIETCHLLIVRWDDTVYGYINVCPHTPAPLDGRGTGQFFNPERTHLMCQKHGALFDVDTGVCLDGPCEGEGLTPLRLAVIDGDVCLTHVRTVEAPGA